MIALFLSGKTGKEILDNMYLTILSRFPTNDERLTAAQYARRPGALPREVAVDLAWALVNSAEFLYRH
jgi:hypothetical protein